MILIIDNYDSFTYNLRDYIMQLGRECVVVRNDEKMLNEFDVLKFDAAVISPGPKTPAEAGITMQFIQKFYLSKPLLGICLGHQAIGEFFGWKLVKAQKPIHGKTSGLVAKNGCAVFKNLPAEFEVMRYHSLVLKPEENSVLEVIASAKQSGEVMAIQHRHLPITGFQFHPESILTPSGLTMLRNWFEFALAPKVVL